MPTAAASASAHEWRRTFRHRNRLLVIAFTAWTLLILVRLFVIMVLQRDTHMAAHQAQTWRAGTLPSLRGRIVSPQGKPLAWSIRIFVIDYTIPHDRDLIVSDLESLRPQIDLNADVDALHRRAGTRVRLHGPLAADSALAIGAMRHPRLSVASTFQRYHAQLDPALLQLLGETRVYGQKEVGVSGLEREYDRQLRGRDGKYQVMIDRRGDWIPESWIELTPPIAGQDLYLTPNDLARPYAPRH